MQVAPTPAIAPAPAPTWGAGTEPAPAPAPAPAGPQVTDKTSAIAAFETARTGLQAMHDAGNIGADNAQVLIDTVASYSAASDFVINSGKAPEQAVAALQKHVGNLTAIQQAFDAAGALAIDPAMDKQLGVAHKDAGRAISLMGGTPAG